jgi:hypothetical protein
MKPHIKRFMEFWKCEGESIRGYGDSPAEAYMNWTENKWFCLAQNMESPRKTLWERIFG